MTRFNFFREGGINVNIMTDIIKIAEGAGQFQVMSVDQVDTDAEKAKFIGDKFRLLPSDIGAYKDFATSEGYRLMYYEQGANKAGVELIQEKLLSAENLALAEDTPGTVTIDWDAVPQATGYVVERATDAAFTENLSTVYTGANLTHDDDTVGTETEYFYRVTATASGYRNSDPVSDSITTQA